MRKTALPGLSGSYMVAASGILNVATGVAAFAYSFRWGSATHLCLLRSFQVRAWVLGAVSTAAPTLGLAITRGHTVSDAGGAAVTPSKKSSTYGASLVTDLRAVGASSTLTVGTRTSVDTPFAMFALPSSAQSATVLSDFSPRGPESDDPIVLRQNEGLILANFTGSTAGTITYTMQMEWAEIESSIAKL